MPIEEWADKLAVYGVSIQLVSPASGDVGRGSTDTLYSWVSIQLVSPASGDLNYGGGITVQVKFPFN